MNICKINVNLDKNIFLSVHIISTTREGVKNDFHRMHFMDQFKNKKKENFPFSLHCENYQIFSSSQKISNIVFYKKKKRKEENNIVPQYLYKCVCVYVDAIILDLDREQNVEHKKKKTPDTFSRQFDHIPNIFIRESASYIFRIFFFRKSLIF